MTTTQERVIGLAEAAEAYIEQVQNDRIQSGRTDYSGGRVRSHKGDIRRRLREMN